MATTNQPEEPKLIAFEINAVMSQLQDSACKDSEIRPLVEGWRGKLLERGYPKRHVERINGHLHGRPMTGRGYEKATELRDRVIHGDCLLLLVGENGPGKTQMAVCWAWLRFQLGKMVGWYRKTHDILEEIKSTWRDGGISVRTEGDILRKYRRAAYLVLDEFHEVSGSDWESRTLINIIDHRYDNMLATVIIANMSEARAREQINPSVMSRVEETGGLVVCDWPSYRSGVRGFMPEEVTNP